MTLYSTVVGCACVDVVCVVDGGDAGGGQRGCADATDDDGRGRLKKGKTLESFVELKEILFSTSFGVILCRDQHNILFLPPSGTRDERRPEAR